MGFALCFIMTTSYHPNLPINLWMCVLPYYYYTSNIRHQHVDDFYGFVRICIIRRSNDATDVGSSAAEFACTTYHWRPTSCSTLLLFGSFVCTVFTYLGHLADVFYWARWWVQLRNSSFSTWAGRRILPGSDKCAMRLFLMFFKLELYWTRWWEATAQ